MLYKARSICQFYGYDAKFTAMSGDLQAVRFCGYKGYYPYLKRIKATGAYS